MLIVADGLSAAEADVSRCEMSMLKPLASVSVCAAAPSGKDARRAAGLDADIVTRRARSTPTLPVPRIDTSPKLNSLCRWYVAAADFDEVAGLQERAVTAPLDAVTRGCRAGGPAPHRSQPNIP
jgi:hypothetical protein